MPGWSVPNLVALIKRWNVRVFSGRRFRLNLVILSELWPSSIVLSSFCPDLKQRRILVSATFISLVILRSALPVAFPSLNMLVVVLTTSRCCLLALGWRCGAAPPLPPTT